ncbi:PBPRA1643 family SWIM/SEC-C metal-binding motif protein [Psychromonas antarctica]|jgi:SWIM/SEC-C metal-binding protein|uniref:PBPRA1643 family SWIM/SEC-C metal-binding motif protein n=1 Tax=Psychromonas antarctica TaxID=67573 RepID=UPI001EE98A1B|nr:PBPRA1643 family SWIM/SEC-C metal-binding motif protein [Psychromonas antarctica]MCG6201900.1 SEC-C domain-containing protein [Psychromonas antarctica]
MSDKFFFKGKKEKKPKHSSYGFNTKRAVKAGSEEAPLVLVVNSEERKAEIELIVQENALFATIEINGELAENISELNAFLNKPKTTTFEKKPNRNDLCNCGSGKKYKKCCG